jgi:hypothetical protein
MVSLQLGGAIVGLAFELSSALLFFALLPSLVGRVSAELETGLLFCGCCSERAMSLVTSAALSVYLGLSHQLVAEAKSVAENREHACIGR